MTPDDDLTAPEGVNEGSGGSSGETDEGAGEAGALAAASSSGRPAGEYDPAPPLTSDLPVTRTDSDEQAGPGQQLQAGEG